MSGPLRLQVQAGGAFLSRVNVLRVMGPAQGAQVRILPPARLGYEALGLGTARQEARAARAPGGRAGPAGSREGSRRSPGARLCSPGRRAPPAARPKPRPGRGSATGGPGGRRGSALPPPRPGVRGTHRIPLRACGPGGKNGPPDSVVWAKEESWVSKKG